MPQPGPVAYHVHCGSLTSFVISTGFAQVAPSSSLFVIQTVRPPLLLPSRISFSLSLPRFLVSGSQTVPVVRSTTGHGLPTVSVPKSATTCNGCQVLPPSKLRRNTVSMSPVSLALFLRPSQNASSAPFFVTT